MSVRDVYKFPEGMRKELESSEVPLAVYQLIGGRIQTILVSEGLIRWLSPSATREDLLKFLDTDMYRDVHREDIVFVATKAKEFAKNKDGRYEVIYRQKLYGKSEYRTIHALGYHHFLEDGTEYTVVVYDDVTKAFKECKGCRQEFDTSLIEFLNNDTVEPFVVVDAKTHEIYMLSASFEKIWKPVRPFDSGITFEDYFFDPDEPRAISLDDVLEKGEVIVPNTRTEGDLILKASRIKWHGKDAIFHRVSERTDRYFDPLTALPNMEYCRMRGESYADDIRIAGGTPAVIFFDIVGMKLYNNANGYDRGNEFLLHFAAKLKKLFPNNLICRQSNDHFTVVTDVRNIEDRLNEVRKYVKGVVSKISMDVNVGICKIEEFETMLDACEKEKEQE